MRTLILLIGIGLLGLPMRAQVTMEELAADYLIDADARSYGVAVGDYDNDLLEDLYISRDNAPNLLYHALPDGTFEEVAAAAGVDWAGRARSVLWADLDNDGFLDILVANTGQKNRYFHNLGDGTFEDRSLASGIGQFNYQTRSIHVADVNGDGLLDIYTANMLEPNELLINNGDGTFQDQCTMRNAQDFMIAMGAVFFDYDLDGDQDLYLTHDSYQANILYRNDGTGMFTDVSNLSGTNIASQGMGVDVGDVDNDGYPDIYITNLGDNTLLRNAGNGYFQNISALSGATDQGMGWGLTWWDADNDGRQDIYVANEYGFSPFPNLLYHNNGDNTFTDVAPGTDLESPYGGYGMATLDVNYDGRLDLVQINAGNAERNQLFVNRSDNENHWIRLQLEQPDLNRRAVGSRVRVTMPTGVQTDEVTVGSGYTSQNSYRLHFGLADQTAVDLQVFWANGDTSTFTGLAADHLYRLRPDTLPEILYPFGEPVNSTDINTPGQEVQLLTNPVQHELIGRWEGGLTGDVTLRILDAQGRVLLTQRFTRSSENTFRLAAGHLAPGAYWLHTQRGEHTQTIPFIKQ